VRTFIIRLLEETGAGAGSARVPPRLRGFVDEVATGLRATFRDEQELVTALTHAVTDRAGPPWGPERAAPGYGPSPDSTETIF